MDLAALEQVQVLGRVVLLDQGELDVGSVLGVAVLRKAGNAPSMGQGRGGDPQHPAVAAAQGLGLARRARGACGRAGCGSRARNCSPRGVSSSRRADALEEVETKLLLQGR